MSKEKEKYLDANEIVARLQSKLPEMAIELIKKHENLDTAEGRGFLENPDDPKEHVPNWHQWGIISHTEMFSRFNQEEVPHYLQDWEIADKITEHQSEQIDGRTKKELLAIAIPLHDLGKFTHRKVTKKNGSRINTFYNHEEASGDIIREKNFADELKLNYGLTDNQLDYIVRCAEIHFELGKLREDGKKSKHGYTIAYTESDDFRKSANALMDRHQGYELEVGLLFLGDSLAKTDIIINANTDEEIENQDEHIKIILQSRGLNPELKDAVKQRLVNKAVAEQYLKIWAGE